MFGFTEAKIALLQKATWETLGMVGAATAVSVFLGLVIGVLLILTAPGGILRSRVTYAILSPIVDITRSIPFIILLVAIIPFTRWLVGTSIGTTAATVPLVVAAIPFVARLVEAALKEVDNSVVEAVTAMGASPWQVVTRVYLPEALPALIRAATTTAISIVGYSAMAGAVGGGGLGNVAITYGYQRFQGDIMLATVVILVVMVQLTQLLGETAARRLDRR
ncbi:MAG TPA: methionine ABC transporter permease [Deinococcales bacterium]|nr:methionine ABC transporter permease [Deinococcales bacterium]